MSKSLAVLVVATAMVAAGCATPAQFLDSKESMAVRTAVTRGQQSGYNPSEPGTAAYAAASGRGPRVATLGQTVPGLFGGIERREERRLARRERRYQENVAYAGQQHDAYNRALDSCLSARDYTVR
jgi:hypothetical protein